MNYFKAVSENKSNISAIYKNFMSGNDMNNTIDGVSTHFGFEHGEEYPKLYDDLKSEILEKLNLKEQNNFNKAENEDKGVVN